MRVLLRGRTLALAGVVALCVLAWWYLFREASAVAGVEGMEAAGRTPGPAEFAYLFVMWSVMMVAMMLPSALPTLLLFSKVVENRRDRGARGSVALSTMAFVLGYLLAWSGYAAIAAAAQWTLQRALLLSPMMVSVSRELSGGLLVLGGAYQFSPIKDRCLGHCRSPLSFIAGHWREGTSGAVRMGAHHGLYCVGCCWALMALLFVLGVMNLFWVAALAALVLVEKVLPRAAWTTPSVGVSLVVAGIWVLAGVM